MKYTPDRFTYGAELELADIDSQRGLPPGFGWDRKDVSMVNSNGVAVDPTHRLYRYGGEINTPPTTTIEEQVKAFKLALNRFPGATVNYRSNLHVHIGINSLRHDLVTLKAAQTYIHKQMPQVLPLIEPIPKPSRTDYTEEAFVGALWRYKRRYRSHQTLLSAKRLCAQSKTTTPEQFFRAEVPASKAGKPMWHAQRRCCVNLRHLRETDTVEFRHFPGTLNPIEFQSALIWCREFTNAMLNTQEPALDLFNRLILKLPKFEPYIHDIEQGYLLTCHDGTVPCKLLPGNIQKVLDWRLDHESISTMSS